MLNEIVERAARNNALWCDAVCAAHDGAGEFRPSLWVKSLGVPRRYPDLVTLIGAEGAPAQMAAIAELIKSPGREERAIKDSFNCLDLAPLGFAPLFDAEWLGAPSRPAPRRSAEVQWIGIDTPPGLAHWEQAWRKASADPGGSRLFTPGLLSRADIRFFSAIVDGAEVGGGVLNAGAGVVGLSNLFADGIDMEAVWSGLADEAGAAFPDLPLVAYDRSDGLAAARRVGFTTIGGLRVWRRAGHNPERRQISRHGSQQEGAMTDHSGTGDLSSGGERRCCPNLPVLDLRCPNSPELVS